MSAATPKKGEIDQSGNAADKVKKGLAFSLVAVALLVFYFFADEFSLLLRSVSLIFALSSAVVLYAFTEKGKKTFSFLLSSRQELHRVTWPTRTETLQTTILILALVFIISIFFWLVDMVLGHLVQWLIA